MTEERNTYRICADSLGLDVSIFCQRALGIVHTLQTNGYEAYLVGGCVRDGLLGLQPKDFDIATIAHPEQVKALFPSCRLVGRRFRLAHIHFGRDYIEVATFRSNTVESSEQSKVSKQGRLIKDNVYGSFEDDVLRRDFTVNALAYDPATHEVIDQVEGINDLKRGHIRLLGEVEQRFREDPVRMLRALRFAQKLNFILDESIDSAIREMAIFLADVPAARLFDETLKLFQGGHGLKTFQSLREFGLLPHLLPMTIEDLEQDNSNGQFEKLVHHALRNTDERIRIGKSVAPFFLMAVFLWQRMCRYQRNWVCQEDFPEYQALHAAAGQVFDHQIQFTAIPRRLTSIIREIWVLQSRFSTRRKSRVEALIENRYFRAAYDFLCLRAESGESVEEDAQWWTKYQEASASERHAMCRSSSRRPRHHAKKRR